MTITYLGQMSLGEAIPAGSAAISATVPDLAAQIAALQAFNPLPSSLAGNLSLAQGILGGVQEAISLGLTPPDISAQIAEVLAALSTLQANLAIANTFLSALAAAGIYLYHYEGTAGSLGSEFASQLASGFPGAGGSTEVCEAVVLASVASASWPALQTVFGL